MSGEKKRILISLWQTRAADRRKLAESLRNRGDEEGLDRAVMLELEADIFELCAAELLHEKPRF